MINMQLTQAGTNNCRTFSINQMSKEVSNKTLTVINLKTTAKLDVVNKFFKNIQTNLETPDSNLISALQTRIEQINQTKLSWFKSFLLFFAPYTKENLTEEKKAWETLVKDIQELSRKQFVELTTPDLSQFKLDSQIQFIQSDLNLINHNFSIYGQTKNFLDGKSIKIITIPTKACLVSTAQFFTNIREINRNQQTPLLSSFNERISFIKTATTGILRNFFLFFTPWTKWSLKAERKTWETVAKDLQEISEKCKALTSQSEKSSVQLNKEPETTAAPSSAAVSTLQINTESTSQNSLTSSSPPTTTTTIHNNNTPEITPVLDSAGFNSIPDAPSLDDSNIPPPPPMDFDGLDIPPPPDFEPPALTGARFSLFNKPTGIQFFSNVSLLPNEPEPPKGFKAIPTDAEIRKLESHTLATQVVAVTTYLAQLTKYNAALKEALAAYTQSEIELQNTIQINAESIEIKTKELNQWKTAFHSASNHLITGSVEIEIKGINGATNRLEYFSLQAWNDTNAKLQKMKNAGVQTCIPSIPKDYIITDQLLAYMKKKFSSLETEIEDKKRETRETRNKLAALQATKFTVNCTLEDKAFNVSCSEHGTISIKELKSGSDTLNERIRVSENAIKKRQQRNSESTQTPEIVVDGMTPQEVDKLKQLSNNVRELGMRLTRRDATNKSSNKDAKPKEPSILPDTHANLINATFGKGTIKRSTLQLNIRS